MEKKVSVKVIIIAAAAVILAVAGICLYLFAGKGITATTMRVLKLEGIVQLEENGVVKTVMENFRLKSGNALSTEQDSQVSIGLDETKIITLRELSRAEFLKKGKKLDLTLTKGSLFFNVKEKLADNEFFNIHTSTMVVGIRGTSGLVFEEGKKFGVIVTDGTVRLKIKDPVTGAEKEIDVEKGQQLVVTQKDDGSVEYEVTNISAKELPAFAAMCVSEDPQLLERVVEDTGWDKAEIISDAAKSFESNGKLVEMTPVPDKDDNEVKEDPSTEASGEDSSTEESTASSEAEPSGEDVAGDEEGGVGEEGDVQGADAQGADGQGDTNSLEAQMLMAQNEVVGIDPVTGIYVLSNGVLFDPVYYLTANADVLGDYGTDTLALIAHWLLYGKAEGRPTIAPETVDYITNLHNPYTPQNPAGGTVGQGGGTPSSGGDGDSGTEEPEKKKKKHKKHKKNNTNNRNREESEREGTGESGGTGSHDDGSKNDDYFGW